MRRIALFCWFAVLPAMAYAQTFPFEYWHKGRVVLESGDTLHGQVKYNLQDDLVQFQSDNRVETFTARKVVFFEIFDQTVRNFRSFFSLPYAMTGQYKGQVFFELLGEGKVTMLSRESLETRSYSSYYTYGTYSRLVLVDKFFLLKQDLTIIPLASKKSDILSAMSDREDQVAKFAKENRLNYERKNDVIRMVAYYNSLFK